MIFCLAARIRLMEFLETTGRKRRYAAPALLTACAGQRAHRIPPGRSPGPRGVRARESEMRVRTECGCHQRRTETFVAAERQQGAASGRRWIPSRLAPGAERDAFGKQLSKPFA